MSKSKWLDEPNSTGYWHAIDRETGEWLVCLVTEVHQMQEYHVSPAGKAPFWSRSTRGRRQQYMKISKPRDPMESEATK